jgi:hypothetical protein
VIPRVAAGADSPPDVTFHPTAQAPFPFSTREFARLLVLKSLVQAGLVGADDIARRGERQNLSSSAQ